MLIGKGIHDKTLGKEVVCARYSGVLGKVR
jgi:hypothetical protein